MTTTITTSVAYDALLAYFKAQTYPQVTYDVTTRARIVGSNVAPASVECNEIGSTFKPSLNRRSDRIDHATWSWQVILNFKGEVDFTNLRNALSNVPNLNGARVILERAKYTHPPRQEPSGGSRAEFVLNVLLRPN